MERTQEEQRLTEALEEHGPALKAGLRIPAHAQPYLSADDILQELYLSAFLALDRMPAEPAGVKAWLKRIAHNLLVDALRSLGAAKRGAGRIAVKGESRGESFFGAQNTTPSQVVRGDERGALLRAAVAELPEPYRTAAEALLAGEPAEELAQRLGKTLGATHMLLTRTRARLKRDLPGDSALLDSF